MATGPDPVGVAGGHSVTVPGAPTGEDLERAHAFELIHGPRVFEQLAQLTSAVQSLIAQDVPQLIANNVYLGNKLDEWTKLAQRLGQEKRDLATYIEQLERQLHADPETLAAEVGLGAGDRRPPAEPILVDAPGSDPMQELAHGISRLLEVIEARELRAERREQPPGRWRRRRPRERGGVGWLPLPEALAFADRLEARAKRIRVDVDRIGRTS